MDISVILPSYLEEENLKMLLPKLKRILSLMNVSYEILVIDTMNKMDDTDKICQVYDVKYINRKDGNLYGDAIRTGVFEAQGSYIVAMDADGSHDPKDIPRFYTEMKKDNLSVVIGSRYCKGGQTENNFVLKFMSWVLNVTYRILFGLKIRDVSNSFRMYETKKIKMLELECNNFDIVEEILIKLKYMNKDFKALEIPILFSKRVAGESKRNLMKFIKSYIITMKRLLSIKKEMRKYHERT